MLNKHDLNCSSLLATHAFISLDDVEELDDDDDVEELDDDDDVEEDEGALLEIDINI